MVRYLKLIVLIFGSIGLLAASFFYFQNKTDISYVLDFRDKFDYSNLAKKCPEYVYPCLLKEFDIFTQKASMTGISMGLKMVFSVMDQDKDQTQVFPTQKRKEIEFALNYLEINNLAMKNSYKHYYGFKNLYGGFIATLDRYYAKAYAFSDNIIIGLEGRDGISEIKNKEVEAKYQGRFKQLRTSYYKIKIEVREFLEREKSRLELDLE